MLKGGVIGFGNMGQKLTGYINGKPELGARVVAACNRGSANLERAKSDFGLWVTRDVNALLERGLDFVLVLSTSYAHADQVAKAAGAGCHIFCEKPIALNLEDADRMIAAVEQAGLVSVVNYGMRFNEAYLKIKQLVDAGEFGEVLAVTHAKMRGFGLYASGARHRAVLEPGESGGWTVHHACHDLDFLTWLLGPIQSVHALTQSTTAVPGSEEIVLGMVLFRNGAIGSIADSVCGIRDHYTLIIGTKASLVMTGEGADTRCRLQREGMPEPKLLPVQDSKRSGEGLDHFFECIRSGTASPHSLRSARHSLAAALAMRESARRGEPVRIED